ncbi:MAG: hypothetical protein IIW07_06715 [Clostridia bacterium]|nr:hypothetical protein [Clostridia bacterium]
MKPLSPTSARRVIYAAYLLPAISFLLLLLYALIPHLYFIYQDTAHETMSLFTMVQNTWRECQGALVSTGSSVAAMRFSYTMSIAVILFWVALALHGVIALASGICALYAFSKSPTDRLSNRAKKLLRFVCPNRVCFLLGGLLPLLYTTFPFVLRHAYREQMSMPISIYTTTHLADVIPAALLVLLGTSLFLATLPLQGREHLDLFRLYKQKSKDKTN